MMTKVFSVHDNNLVSLSLWVLTLLEDLIGNLLLLILEEINRNTDDLIIALYLPAGMIFYYHLIVKFNLAHPTAYLT